jgi:hypothetical protein
MNTKTVPNTSILTCMRQLVPGAAIRANSVAPKKPGVKGDGGVGIETAQSSQNGNAIPMSAAGRDAPNPSY